MSFRSFFLLSLIILLFPGQLFAAGPHIEVLQPDFQFGTIRQGEQVPHTFIFKNTGDQPLEITKVKSSCGCTAALVDERQIAPGASGEVKVNFDSTRFSGSITKTVYIYTNDLPNKLVQLHLRGEIKAELQLSSRRLQIGPVAAGTVIKTSVTLTNSGSDPVSLSGLRTSLPEVSVTLDRNDLKSGETATIELQAVPKIAGKNLSGYLFCDTSNPYKPELRLPFTVLVNQ